MADAKQKEYSLLNIETKVKMSISSQHMLVAMT